MGVGAHCSPGSAAGGPDESGLDSTGSAECPTPVHAYTSRTRCGQTALTLHFVAPVGFSGPSNILYARIEALGPPRAGATTLRDEAGLNVTSITLVYPSSRCGGLPIHVAVRDAPASDPDASPEVWCLRISGLQVGSSVSGTMIGTGTELTVSLAVRDNFFYWPFLCVLLGIAIALVAALLAAWAKRVIPKGLVDAWVSRNLASRTPIVGLRDWVEDQRRRGTSSETLLMVIEDVAQHGPHRISDERKDLSRLALTSRLPQNSPLLQIAEDEAARSDLKVSDLLDANGRKKDDSPGGIINLIQTAIQIRSQLDNADELARQLYAESSTYQERVQSLRMTWEQAKDQDDLVTVEKGVDELRVEMAAMRRSVVADVTPRTPEPEPRAAASLPAELPARHRRLPVLVLAGFVVLFIGVALATTLLSPAGTPSGLPPPSSIPPTSPPPSPVSSTHISYVGPLIVTVIAVAICVGISLFLFRHLRRAVGATAVALGIAVSILIGSVAISAYASNPSFGSAADYWRLLLATTTSGSLGSVLAVLAYWKITET